MSRDFFGSTSYIVHYVVLIFLKTGFGHINYDNYDDVALYELTMTYDIMNTLLVWMPLIICN